MAIDNYRLFRALYGERGNLQLRPINTQSDGTQLALSDAIEQTLAKLAPEAAQVIRTQFEETPLLEQALTQMRSPTNGLRQFCVIHI